MAQAAFGGALMHELKKILLATDLDGNSDAIVSTAAMLSQAFDSRILLLHVMPDVLPDTLTDEDGPDPVAALLDELKVRIEADASVAPTADLATPLHAKGGSSHRPTLKGA
jgi:nucleotide-binding universal stress UspA family protein